MKKYTLLTILFACFAVFPGLAESPLVSKQSQLVQLYRRADKQRDLMHKLLSSDDVNLQNLSIAEIKKTVSDLDAYKEEFIRLQGDGRQWGEAEKDHLNLIQELIRQLTKARREYEARVTSSDTMKKIGISMGSGLGVAALVKIADAIFDLQLDNTTVIACGLVTSGVVGGVSFREEISEGLGAVKDTVSHAWSNESAQDTATVLAALAGAAATGTILWKSYDLFMSNRPKQVGLEELVAKTHIA